MPLAYSNHVQIYLCLKKQTDLIYYKCMISCASSICRLLRDYHSSTDVGDRIRKLLAKGRRSGEYGDAWSLLPSELIPSSESSQLPPPSMICHSLLPLAQPFSKTGGHERGRAGTLHATTTPLTSACTRGGSQCQLTPGDAHPSPLHPALPEAAPQVASLSPALYKVY